MFASHTSLVTAEILQEELKIQYNFETSIKKDDDAEKSNGLEKNVDDNNLRLNIEGDDD